VITTDKKQAETRNDTLKQLQVPTS